MAEAPLSTAANLALEADAGPVFGS